MFTHTVRVSLQISKGKSKRGWYYTVYASLASGYDAAAGEALRLGLARHLKRFPKHDASKLIGEVHFG